MTTLESSPVVVSPSPMMANEPQSLTLLAMAKDLDLDKLERLIALQEREEARRAKAAFNAAMAKCVAEFPTIARDSRNLQTSSQYAKVEVIYAAITPVLSRNGFSLTCRAIPEKSTPTHLMMQLIVRHAEGHTDDQTCDVFPIQMTGLKGGAMMTEMHARGSAYTYGQRYMTVAYFGLSVGGQDNDGNKVGGFITLEEIEEINTLIEKLRKYTPHWHFEGFLKWMGVESLDQIPSTKVGTAIMDLNQKIRAGYTASQKAGAK